MMTVHFINNGQFFSSLLFIPSFQVTNEEKNIPKKFGLFHSYQLTYCAKRSIKSKHKHNLFEVTIPYRFSSVIRKVMFL